MNPFQPTTSVSLSTRGQSCPNRTCSFFGKTESGNVIMHSRIEQRVRCNSCRKTWVLHRNTALFRLRTEVEKFQAAGDFLRQGMSVRKTAVKLSVSPSTVQRWKKRPALSIS